MRKIPILGFATTPILTRWPPIYDVDVTLPPFFSRHYHVLLPFSMLDLTSPPKHATESAGYDSLGERRYLIRFEPRMLRDANECR